MLNITAALDQYREICRKAIIESGAKLHKRVMDTLLDILLLYAVMPGKVNFTRLGMFGRRGEQCYRQFFNRSEAEGVDWLAVNISLMREYFTDATGRRAIAIDPSYITKSGKKTPHIGYFWSGCAGAAKRGLEILGIGLVDTASRDCVMLRAHQTLNTDELKDADKTLIECYIGAIKRYREVLLTVSKIIVADAYFSNRPFCEGINELGFSLVSRFRNDASLYYAYTGPRSGKPGRPKEKDGKIDFSALEYSRMETMDVDSGSAYTLLAYSKALKRKVRLVIWLAPEGGHRLFFATDTELTGREVMDIYRTRFQIEFCFRDAKQFLGLCHCQARHERQLDTAFNVSFTALNAAKLMMRKQGMNYSMVSFKSLMHSSFLAKRIFCVFGCRPNETLISRLFKQLIGYRDKAA